MNININIVEASINYANSKISKDHSEAWKDYYKEMFNLCLLSYEEGHYKTMPIKLFGVKDFCKKLKISALDFSEAYYQLDLNINKKGRRDINKEDIFYYVEMLSSEGIPLDMAINTFNPCLIKMIFAYLQKPELIDEALVLIEEYEKD